MSSILISQMLQLGLHMTKNTIHVQESSSERLNTRQFKDPYLAHARLAQKGEHQAEVTSSILTEGTILLLIIFCFHFP